MATTPNNKIAKAKKVRYGTKGLARGKQVTITLPSGAVAGIQGVIVVYAVLDEDITLNINSTFEPFLPAFPISTQISKLGNLFKSTGSKGFTGQTKHMGFQSWTKSDPIQFTAQLGFYATYSAKNEVYDPMIILAKAVLPTIGSAGQFFSPGPSFVNTFKDDKGKTVKRSNVKKVDNNNSSTSVSGNTYSIQIGEILSLKNVILTKAEPTFSSEITSDGYPIWGKLALDIKTTSSAYQSLLDSRR